MRTSRFRRQAPACRARTFCSCILMVIAAAAARAADRAAGVVVDQGGRPLPRAFVRVIDDAPGQASSAFSDERGQFALATGGGPCRIEASLSGFSTASAPCAAAAMRIVLPVAPIAETIVVSATRTEAPADQVGASVSTFTAADIERRRTPLVADLLRTAPGAMILRTGAPGGVTSLFVRGGESTYNKVLVDGIPINEPGGTFFFSNLTTDNLERIEFVRGAQSALFGSDAMASVVQLFTRRAGPDDRSHGRFTVEGGSYGTIRAGGFVSGRSGRYDYSAGASRESTTNRVPNSDFDNNSVSINAGAAVGGSATLRFIGRGDFGRNGAPGTTAFGRPDLDAFGRRHDGVAGIVLDQQLTPALRQHATYALALSNQQSTNLTLDPPYLARFGALVGTRQSTDFLYDSRTDLRRHHASYQADVRIANTASSGNQLLTVLVDWDGERASLVDLRANTSNAPTRDNVGVAIQHQAVWRRVVASAGVRIEDNDSFGTATVPRASLVVVAREGRGAAGATRLHVSAGAGIKEPTLLQSFSPSPFFHGNPDLQPERSTSVEAGVDQRFADDRAKVTVTWFDNRYRNLVSTRTTNPETFEAAYFNIGRTKARGAELSLDIAPAATIRAHAGYTFLDSHVVDSTSPTSAVLRAGQALFRRPRHSGFVDVSWSHGRAAASVTGVVVGHYVDSDFSTFSVPILENPGFATWDARGSYQFTRTVAGLIAIDNIGDSDHMEPLGYQALRRAFRAGLRLGF